MLNSFLKEKTCHSCSNTIHKGQWFCRACGRSRGINRFLQFKKWELIVASAGAFVLLFIAFIILSTLIVGIQSVASDAFNEDLNISSPTSALVNDDSLLPTVPAKTPTNTRIPQPTKTPINTSFTNYSCPDKSQVKLRVGDRAVVARYDMNLRSSPIVPEVWDANIIIMLREGDEMIVVGGPKCAHDGTWWEVQTDNGYTGWAREMQPNKILLEPLK